MGDNHSFLTSNRDPVDTMISYLTTLFDPSSPEPGVALSFPASTFSPWSEPGHEQVLHNFIALFLHGGAPARLFRFLIPRMHAAGYDLSISGGESGARLSHSHEKQYYYVLQSLTLWREIAHDMFRSASRTLPLVAACGCSLRLDCAMPTHGSHRESRLWYLSEEDLLDLEHRYELKNTGQGFQRVQQAPRISMAMRHILHHTQEKVR